MAFPFSSSVLPLSSISTLKRFLTLNKVPHRIKEAQTSDMLLFGRMQTGFLGLSIWDEGGGLIWENWDLIFLLLFLGRGCLFEKC